MPLIAADTTAWMLALGIAVFASLMLARSRRPATMQHEPPRSSPHKLVPTAVETPHNLEAWEAESHERIREWTAVIDNKMALLQQLITSAHQEAERLNSLLEAFQRTQQTGESDRDPVPSATGSPPPPHVAVATTTVRPGRTHTPPVRAQIETLAAAGCTPDEIARDLGLPLGEVELIVNLLRQQETAQADSPSARPNPSTWHAQDAYMP